MNQPEAAPKQNFLADIAGFEFECSISAAELNKSVHQSFENELPAILDIYAKPRVVVGHNSGQQTQTERLETRWEINYGSESLPVQLYRPATIEPFVVEVSKVDKPPKRRRWLPRQAAEVEPVKTLEGFKTIYGDPFLGVTFDEVVLPVVTFAQRLDSETCSYVQLGSEIQGDDLFATALDEVGDRKSIIEEIRGYQNSRRGKRSKPAPKGLAALIELEIERQQNDLRLCLERELAGELDSFTAVEPDYIRLIDIKGNLDDPVTCLPLTPQYEFSPDVSGWLAVTGDQNELKTISLILRGNIGLPLVVIDQEGAFTPKFVDKLPVSALRQLQRLVTRRPISHERSADPRITIEHDVEADHEVNRGFLYAQALGWIDNQRKTASAKKTAYVQKQVADGINAEGFIKLLGFDKSVDGKHDFQQAALNELFEDNKQSFIKLFVELGAPEAAADVLKPGTPPNEALLRYVAACSPDLKNELTGTVHNLQIGSTVGSLDFKAELIKDQHQIRMFLKARPHAMPQEPFRDLYHRDFDYLGKPDLDDDKASELLAILRQLSYFGADERT